MTVDGRLRKLLNAASKGPRPGQWTPVGLCHRCRKKTTQHCPLWPENPLGPAADVKYVVYKCPTFLVKEKAP